jgi:hypothetical protein
MADFLSCKSPTQSTLENPPLANSKSPNLLSFWCRETNV